MIRTGVFLSLLAPALLSLAGCVAPARLGPFQFSVDRVTEEPQQAAEDTIEQAAEDTIEQAALSNGLSQQDAQELARILETTDEAYRPMMKQMFLATLARQREDRVQDSRSATGEDADGDDDAKAARVPPAESGRRTAGDRLSKQPRAASDVAQRPAATPDQGSSDASSTTPAKASLSDQEPNDSRAVPEEVVASAPEPAQAEGLADADQGQPEAGDQPHEAVAGKTASLEPAAAPPLPGEQPSAGTDPLQLTWQQALRQTIQAIQDRLANEDLSESERKRVQAQLGLLNVIAEDPESAVGAFEDLDAEELEFWRQTTMALDVLLASHDLPRRSHRIELATDHLRSGVKALATLGPLHVGNLAFCTKVSGFGDFREFESYTFTPGQQVLLYVEIEDFAVEQVESVTTTRSTSGFSTRQATHEVAGDVVYKTELHARYEILDDSQRRVATKVLPVDRETCRNHRQDYYIPYLIYLPTEIAPGHYRLELSVEDKKGIGKVGFAAIDFQIKR